MSLCSLSQTLTRFVKVFYCFCLTVFPWKNMTLMFYSCMETLFFPPFDTTFNFFIATPIPSLSDSLNKTNVFSIATSLPLILVLLRVPASSSSLCYLTVISAKSGSCLSSALAGVCYSHVVLLDLHVFCNPSSLLNRWTPSQFHLLIYNFFFIITISISILSWFLIVISVTFAWAMLFSGLDSYFVLLE